MPKILFENLSESPVTLVIEPWAMAEEIAPEGRAHFEYTEPADVEFAVHKQGEAFVAIMTDRLVITVNGKETIFEAPDGQY